MTIVRRTLDPRHPPRLSDATKARLDAMTDEEITAAALGDPDNPPLTDGELRRLRASRQAKRARARTGLSQDRFAEAYGITLGRLRDIEQGRGDPDRVLFSLLAMIEDDPERAQRLVSRTAD